MGGFTTPIRTYVTSKSNRAWDRTAAANDHVHERAERATAFLITENCRLFRRRPDIYFSGRVHELVEPQIISSGLDIGLASFFIHHFGHLERNARQIDKGIYYRDLLRIKVEEEPNDARAWTQLGLQEYESFRDKQKALYCLQHALNLEPNAAEAWLFLAMVHVDAKSYQEALNALDHDKRRGPSFVLHEQVCGDALRGLGRIEDARLAYSSALKIVGSDPTLQSKLGLVEVKLGQYSSGFANLHRAIRDEPGKLAVQERLVKAYMTTGRFQKAAVVADPLTRQASHPTMFLIAASLYASLPDWSKCLQTLDRGLAASRFCRVAKRLH